MSESLMKKVDFVSPPKYATVSNYREYLRKTFNYSCAYCTVTEAEVLAATFNIDHFRPKSLFPQLERDCTNLRYACPRCNIYKSDHWIPKSMGCHRNCASCKTRICTTNIPRFIDVRVEEPSDYLYEKDDHICAYDGSKVAEYTIRSLRLNRDQLVRLRHNRRFMENWAKDLEDLLSRTKLRMDEIEMRMQTFSTTYSSEKGTTLYNISMTLFELLKAEEESNICLIQSQISRLDALRNRLTGRDD